MSRTLSRKGHLQNLKESPPKYLVITKKKEKKKTKKKKTRVNFTVENPGQVVNGNNTSSIY